MPSGQPTPQDAHVDRILTQISIAYMQSRSEFIASQVFPIIPSARQSDRYYKYNKDDWYRLEAKKRAPGTESAGSGWELATDSFYCDVFAVHKDLDAQLRANAEEMFDLDSEASEWVARQLLMQLEKEFVTAYFGTNIWTGAATGNDQTGVAAAPGADQFLQWNDPASDPIADVEDLMNEMGEQTGFTPNTLVFGPQVGAALRRHPDILDRIKYTQRGVITNDLIASLFGVQRIFEARSTRNKALEDATDDMEFFYGKNALLLHVADSPGRLTPSAGYTFGWTGYTGTGGIEGIGTGSRTSVIDMPALRSTRIEGEMAVDMKVVAPDLGIFLASAVA